ncbi:MAG: division/cell wall cluster transcriptional repressor MraZ [Gammaproteobacteria bacterium]|nr:division/cell wall cluster transcriptional repressor MraZ [Gammaproteobacteria bacterium]
MFRGEYPLNLDSKGRLAVPSRYRERLAETCGGKLVITISLLERCLVAYPFPDWQRIEDALRELPALDAKAQALSHLLIGHANECDMDGHGRLLVPQNLREFAGLEKRIKMVGQVRKFELWDDDTWTARREALLAEVDQLKSEPSDALRGLVL